MVDDVMIRPGQVGIVTCKLGESLPDGEFLVDGDIGSTRYKGILRKALHPGRYRINPYGYEVKVVKTQKMLSGNQEKYSGWVEIPTGYVGVVTNLSDNPLLQQKAGIQSMSCRRESIPSTAASNRWTLWKSATENRRSWSPKSWTSAATCSWTSPANRWSKQATRGSTFPRATDSISRWTSPPSGV